MRSVLVPSLLASTAMLCLPAAAVEYANPLMEDLGLLAGQAWSYAHAISPAGAVVVGYSGTNSTSFQAFRWQSGTMAGIGFLPGGGSSEAWGVNADGTVIVGQADAGTSVVFHAFRWVEGTGMQDIGALGSASNNSFAYDVNAAGNVVVGFSDTAAGRRAFRWVDGVGMENLGLLENGSFTYAFGVNAAGNVVVGYGDFTLGQSAFRWVEGAGMDRIGILAGGNWSVAWGVNPDGTQVVGSSGSTDGARAFRWVAGVGMESLGVMAGGTWSNGYDVNDDGTVVVGYGETSGGDRAFRWVEGEGMESLGVLEGGTWSVARGVSGAGDVVTGTSDTTNGARAFVWRSGTMLDFANTATAVHDTAAAMGAAAAQFAGNAEGTLGRELYANGAGVTASTKGTGLGGGTPMALRLGLGAARNADVAGLALSDATVALGFGNGLTLNGFVGLGRETQELGAVSLDGNYLSGGVALRYHAMPDRSGLTFRLAVIAAAGDVGVTRLALLPDTETGVGQTSLHSTAASIEAGYGLASGAALWTPFLRLSAAHSTRAAYAEDASIAFPLSFDAHTEDLTSLTLGVTGRIAASPRGTLELGAGLTRDLSRSANPVTGTSALPGFETFSVAAPEVVNPTRGYLSVGYTHALANGAAIGGSLAVAQSPWGKAPTVSLSASYEIRF